MSDDIRHSGSNSTPYRAGSYPAARVPELQDAESGASLGEILLVLRRRWILVLAGIVVGLLAATHFVVQAEPQYRAVAVFQLADGRALAGGLVGPAGDPLGRGGDPMATQLEVLRSRSVIGRVVDREGLRLRRLSSGIGTGHLVGLEIDPYTTADRLQIHFDARSIQVIVGADTVRGAYGETIRASGISFAVPGPPGVQWAEFAILSRDAAVDRVTGSVRARVRDRTSIVDVEFTASDPHLAQDVVNRLVEEFAAHSATQAQQQSRRRRAFLAEQLAQVESVLSEAQARLADFRSREGVYSSREHLSAQHAGLLNMEARREELAADRRMYQSLLNALSGSTGPDVRQRIQTLVAAPGIAENSIVSQHYSQLRQFEIQREDLVTRGASATNPDVARLETQINATREALIDAVSSHIAGVDARIQALDDLRRRISDDLAPLPALEAQEGRLLQEVEAIRGQAAQLRDEYQRAGIAEAVATGQVEIIDLATRPGAPVPSRHARILIVGLLGGLALGGILGLGIDQLDRRVRSRQDVEVATGVAVLAMVPRFTTDAAGRNGRHPLLTVTTRTAASETFRSLRTMLRFSRDERLDLIGVTSAEPGEGKSVVASNLAVMMTGNETRVLLVDADFPRPVLHSIFDFPRSPGLSDLLVGAVRLSDVVHYDEERRIHVLPAGSPVPASAELLAGKRFRALIEDIRAKYDVVVVDTPPVLAVADALSVAGVADGMLLVARADSTDRFALREAAAHVRGAGGDIVATILNDVRARSAELGYYRGSYYTDYHQEPPAPPSRLKRILGAG